MSCSLYEARENREKTLTVLPCPSIVDVDVVSGSGVCAGYGRLWYHARPGKKGRGKEEGKIDMGNLHFSETS